MQGVAYSIIEPLTEVFIGPDRDIAAVIESVSIKPKGAIWYKIAWWAGRERREAEVPSTEVGIASPNNLKTVGFINN
jgi:hypothetical protein